MKSKKRKEPQPICATENIPLFVMYIRKELTTEQELKLDKHMINCEDCRLNFAYTEEILQFKHVLTIDEKTLLLRYMADPLWYYSLHSLKQQILKELKQDNKIATAGSAGSADTLQSSNNSNSLTNSNKSNDIVSDEKTLTSKTNTTITKLKSHNNNRVYQYITLALCVTTFISLASTLILATKTKYPNFLSFSFNERKIKEPVFPNPSSNLISTSISTSTVTDNNLYQQLDTAIDEFLSSQNKDSLNKAISIATSIEKKYQDKYGVDLVAYYRSVTAPTRNELLVFHKKLQEMASKSSGDNYQQRLAESQELEKTFLGFGNLVEAYKAKTLTSKFYVQLNKNEEARQSIQQGLDFSLNKQYLCLQTDFLLWQAKRLSRIPDFINAEKSFIEVIELANKLNLDKSRNSAGTSLAMIYHQADDNEKAFELTKKLLLNFDNYKNSQAISLLQIAGLTSFNLGYHQLAESYLKEAIKNSEEINSPVFTVRSYAFLGLILSEEKKFFQAEEIYAKAELVSNNISETNPRLEALGIIAGYQAKTKLLANDNEQALVLYQRKLDIMKKINLESNLEISQLHQGMAIALTALDQKEKAQKYSTIASHYQYLAKANNETTNCLLYLVPTNCGLVQP